MPNISNGAILYNLRKQGKIDIEVNGDRKDSMQTMEAGASGMTEFISQLTGANGINQTTLWSAIIPVATTVAIVVIFALSYRVLRKLVKGVSKGKANF